MYICKIIGHKLIQPKDSIFCQRCGMDKGIINDLEYLKIAPIIRGKTQFVEPTTFQERFNNARNISEILES